MNSLETIDLGSYRGENYFLAGFVEPDPSQSEEYDPDTDADNYGVVLGKEGSFPHEKNEEVVRMDTRHEGPHMDRLYLPPDSNEDRKIWLDDDYRYSRMKKYLEENWKRFADLYIQYNE